MTGFRCDADALLAAGAVLDEVGDRMIACRFAGMATDPALWGPLGRLVGASAEYQALVGATEEHLTAGRRFCDRAAGALRRCAAAYAEAEAAGASGFAGTTGSAERSCDVR